MVITVSPVKHLKKPHPPPPKQKAKIFKVLLLICQLFCAAPVERYKKLHYASCVIVLTSIFVATCSQEELLRTNMSTIQKALYLSEYVANNGLVLLAIITSYVHKDCYKTFPRRLQELESRTQAYKNRQSAHHSIQNELRAVAILGGLFFGAVFVFHYLNAKNYRIFFRSSTVYILPNMIIILVIGQYCLLTKLTTFRSRDLNAALEGLIEDRSCPAAPFTLLVEVVRSRHLSRLNTAAVLRDLRDVFAKLDTLVGDVNAVFGLTLTANFLSCLLALSIHIFVLYKVTDQGVKTFLALMVYTLLWIVLHSLKLIFILYVNSELLEEKARTGSVLNDLESEDMACQDAINEFLLQLLVRKNVQVACGMIRLDMAFVGGVLSALSIYVIFLIQVDLGEVSLTGRAPANTTKDAKSVF